MRALRLPKVRWAAISFRLGAAVVGVFVTLWMTYAIAVNALLITGVGKALLNRAAPTQVHVEWRTAYSPWFLRVYTTGFVIRGDDTSVQWLVATDRANGSFRLMDFFSRRVRLHDTWARGITTRIHFRPADADDEPPLLVTDENYRFWSIEIDDVVGDDVREVSVDTIRVVAMGGHVEGGFHLRPQRSLFVRPTECRVEDASVFDRNDPIATHLHATFALHIAELDLRTIHGADLLRHFDAAATGQAKVGALRFLDPWLRSEHVALSGGTGPTQFTVSMQRGELVAGSSATMRSEGFLLWSNRNGLSGTALALAVIPPGKPHLAIAVEIYGADVHRDKTVVAHAPVVAASADIDNLDMTKPFDQWAVSIDVPSATAHDLKAFDAYLDEPMFFGGSATINAHANVTPDAVSGHAKVDVSRAVMEVSKTVVTASGSAEATLHGFDNHSGRGDLAGARLDLHAVSSANQTGWWADLSANPLTITFKHGLTVSGSITGKCRDAQLPLAVLDAPGIVRGVFGTHGFTGSGYVRISHHGTDLSDLRLVGNTLQVRAHYHAGSGAALVETPVINVGVLIRNGETSPHPFATRDWYVRTLAVGAGPRADRR